MHVPTMPNSAVSSQDLIQVREIGASGATLSLDLIGSVLAGSATPSSYLQVVRSRETTTTALKQRLEARFRKLADEWMRDTQFSSSTSDINMHPSYQRIIAMGSIAIPLILRALQERPHHWFWALWILTGESPIPENAKGNVPLMTQAWLKWGRRQGYLD